MKTLNRIRSQNRQATSEEQAVLVKYVGWGGLPQAFDQRNDEWKDEFAELAALVSSEEYEAARRSTQDAHYTPRVVVEGVYKGLRHLGFPGGKIIDPAIGTGHFVGLMPQDIRSASSVTGIELDPITAAIAKALYPSTPIINRGFQETGLPTGYFDAAVGNPPFGNQRLYDPLHEELKDFSIHNFFVAKSLDGVREGGVVAMVISSYFLDAMNPEARAFIADRAHLLGAIRLPQNAFKENALTEVTTDIVFLQKARAGDVPERGWVETGSIPDPDGGDDITLNRYFVAHPEMMLGTMRRVGSMFRGGRPALVADDAEDLVSALEKRIQALPAGVYVAPAIELAPVTAKEVIDVPDVKIGAYFVHEDGRIARRTPDKLDRRDYEWVTPRNERAGERIKGLIEIRDTLRALMDAELADLAPDYLETLRHRLNRSYDSFVKRHGYISAQANKLAMEEDPEYPLLHALERDYDRGVSEEMARKHNVPARAPSARKAAIFSTRVITPRRPVERVETAKEALLVSLNETGRVDFQRMARISGKSEEILIHELRGLIFKNPQTGHWEGVERYLSGNVKEKLATAVAATERDPEMAINVEALRRIQPPDIDPVDIILQLGSTWIPDDVVDAFVGHLLGNVYRRISYQPTLGKWLAKISDGDRITSHVTWGTEYASAASIVTRILEGKPIEVRDPAGRDESGAPIYKTNEEKTAAAAQKADEIRQAFLDWVWEDKERRTRLARIYNDRFNTNVEARYDGSHLTLPGASAAIELRPHQKNGIWRGIQEGSTLFDHVVGAGKTFEMIATAMESKRMGLISKPMFPVPNHLLLQWKDAFYELYPNAKVLVAEKTDFEKANRQRLFAKIATGDWDAVIVGHSSFKKIGMPKETLQAILDEQIEDLSSAIIKLKDQRGDRLTIKEMEKARDRMKAKVQRAAEGGKKDDALSFADLGVDALFVDELHEFKNLWITTSLTRIAGLGNLEGAEKAFDLFVKTRYLQQANDGRGFFGGTGTPISNTIAEVYTLQRYFQYDDLKRRGIVHFDSWASTFGSVVTGWELDATGVNYKLNSRFAKFQNVPELTAMYRSFADVISKEDLQRQAAEQGKRFPVPRIKGGKPENVVVQRSEQQARFMGVQEPVIDEETGKPATRSDGTPLKDWTKNSIIWRMEHLPDDPRIDNPLKITNEARKAGLDFRLIRPSAPDHEGSKINVAVDRIYKIWKKWEDRKGTQLVFCDLSTPKGKSRGPAPILPSEDNDNDEQEAISMDELLSVGSAFNVYDDIKAKLIAKGIPEHEIRFIHDATTDLQKARLFDDMNRGVARVLLGSTTKMGAGTNVQRKLVAEHQLDAPWRPSDLEQRGGRIERQGNEFYEEDPDGFEVEIIRYSTSQTYDARMWQTIEYKAVGIEQFRRGGAQHRVIDDIASEAANAAEMKAAATGNNLIFIQVQLQAELKKLEAVFSSFKRSKYSAESRAEWLEQWPERLAAEESRLQAEMRRRDAATDGKFRFEAAGRLHGPDDKDRIQDVLLTAIQRAIENRGTCPADREIDVPVGKYRGFDITVTCFRDEVQFKLHGEKAYKPLNMRYDTESKFEVNGFFRRIDHVLGSFEEALEDVHAKAKSEDAELLLARNEVAKPFAQMQKLEMLRKDVGEVMAELKKCQADPDYVSTWQPISLGSAHGRGPSDKTGEAFVGAADASRAAAQQALASFKEAALHPVRGEEVLAVVRHHQLMEQPGVREELIRVVNEDQEAANIVSSYPVRHFVPDDLLHLADRSAGHLAIAETIAKDKGYAAFPADRQSGSYAGRVLAVTDKCVVHEIGRSEAVVHRRDDLLLLPDPRPDDVLKIHYQGGRAKVVRKDRDIALER